MPSSDSSRIRRRVTSRKVEGSIKYLLRVAKGREDRQIPRSAVEIYRHQTPEIQILTDKWAANHGPPMRFQSPAHLVFVCANNAIVPQPMKQGGRIVISLFSSTVRKTLRQRRVYPFRHATGIDDGTAISSFSNRRQT